MYTLARIRRDIKCGLFMSPLFWLVRGFVVGETSSLSIWQQMQEDML